MTRTTIQITPKNTIISTNCFSLQNSLNSFCRSHPGLCQLRVSSVHGGATYRIRKHSDFLYLYAIICNELKHELDEEWILNEVRRMLISNEAEITQDESCETLDIDDSAEPDAE